MKPEDQEIENLEDIERFFRTGREWLKTRHDKGLSGAELGQTYSNLMDSLIRRLVKRALSDQAERSWDLGFCLLAVGGYGREEVSPFSDVDLLLLHPPRRGKELEEC